jgi:hypothetical protein
VTPTVPGAISGAPSFAKTFTRGAAAWGRARADARHHSTAGRRRGGVRSGFARAGVAHRRMA